MIRDHRLLEDETVSVLVRLTLGEVVQLLSTAGPDDHLRRRLEQVLDLLEAAS